MNLLIFESEQLLARKKLKFDHLLKSDFKDVYLEIKSSLGISNCRQILWHAINNLPIPLCKCGKTLSWHPDKNEYRQFCSRKCTALYSQDKIKATNIQKYGVDYYSKSTDFAKKIKQTSIEKFGEEHYSKTKEFKNSVKQTNLKKFGVEHPAQSDVIQTKMKETMLSRYGVENSMHIKENVIQARINTRIRQFDAVIAARSTATNLFTLTDYIENDSDTEWPWECNICKLKFNQKLRNDGVRCPNCSPLSESSGERIIRQWLEEHKIPFIQNDRQTIKPFELDFVIPSKHIAIEFNGIWWHSEKILNDRSYHFKKFKMAKDAGLNLIQVWEHDLNNKHNIILNRLTNAFGLIKNRIGARECDIKVIDSEIAKAFLNRYHLQGYHRSKYHWGAFYNNDLVSVISISKNRFSKKAEYELTRFANKSDISIAGNLSKLLNAAKLILGPTTLITYADLCWGQGNVYKQAGFEFKGFSKPNYWYFKNIDDIKSRMSFQKHKIIGKAPGSTEIEIATNMGYNRFYDAGNAVWVKNL